MSVLPYGPGWDSATHSYPTPQPATATGTSFDYNSLLGTYNKVPQPTSGQGAYGLVPGATPLPPSTYTQTNAADPGLAAGNDQLNSNIMSELSGELSPQVMKNLQDTAARFGVTSGMPGSNAIPGSIAFNKNLLDNVQTTQARQAQGQKDYQSQEALVAGQQLNPALISGINENNATLASAPDPTQAAQQQLANYYAALNSAKGPGGGSAVSPGPSGGTGTFAPTLPGGTPSPSPFTPGQSSYAGMTPGDSNSLDAFWNQGTNIPSTYDSVSQGNFGLDQTVPNGYDSMQSFYDDLGG